MTIYITKQINHSFNYLLNWYNPETGAMMGFWVQTLREALEYTAGWPGRKVIRVNF